MANAKKPGLVSEAALNVRAQVAERRPEMAFLGPSVPSPTF